MTAKKAAATEVEAKRFVKHLAALEWYTRKKALADFVRCVDAELGRTKLLELGNLISEKQRA